MSHPDRGVVRRHLATVKLVVKQRAGNPARYPCAAPTRATTRSEQRPTVPDGSTGYERRVVFSEEHIRWLDIRHAVTTQHQRSLANTHQCLVPPGQSTVVNTFTVAPSSDDS